MSSSSYLANSHFFTHDFTSTQENIAQHCEPCIGTSQALFLQANDCVYLDESSIISHALALLQTTNDDCMNDHSQPNIRVESSTPQPLPPTYDGRQDSVTSAFEPSANNWQQMYQASMGGPVASTRRPLKRARTHQRTPSASTVASNGPASPYTANTSYPHIANTDYSPNSPAHYADQAAFSTKHLPTPQQTPTDSSFATAGYIPSQVSHTPNGRLAMSGFPIDHQFSDEFPPDFIPASRQSMSSGHDSPATPQSHAGDHYDPRGGLPMNQNGEIVSEKYESEIDYSLYGISDYRQPNPNVQLYRTESQAYQDELFNPTTYTSTSASAPKRASDFYLSPHRNLVTERLQTANLARSASPTSVVSRERSPFRDGSPLAPTTDWQSAGQVGTAAGMRQQQKEEAEQAEYAQHVPSLQREPTKTISPKDALLDYHDTEQPPLFQDQVPAGYKQHNGGSENWQKSDNWQNTFVSQPGSSFGALSAPVTSAQQMTVFRATPNGGVWPEANFHYMSLPLANNQEQSQIQGTPFHGNAYTAPSMDYSDTTPEFPAHLTSMESSVSEGGPPLSSQNSFSTPSGVQRPMDTRANTGTYTCTYHGCTERFDTHINLQKHKRDFHRSQQHNKESTSTPTGTDSTPPRSTESPAPSGSGMTSAAILARNSQAGPHKCSRINPSTNKPCNTVFSRPYDLTRHEDTIHNNRKQKVRCPMCREEKTFSRNDALTRHMRVVHPEVESFGKRSRRGD